MNEIKPQIAEKPAEIAPSKTSISRRLFLQMVAVMTGIGVAEVATEGKFSWFARKIKMLVESQGNYADDEVTLNKERALITENTKFKSEIMGIKIKNKDKKDLVNFFLKRYLLITTFSDQSTFTLTETPSNLRKDALAETSGSVFVGPVPPVTNGYEYTQENPESKNVDFMFPAITDSKTILGPQNLADRMQGENENLNNQSSGGIIFENGKIRIVNKDELQKALDEKISCMQAWFTISNNNEQELLSKTWTHHHIEATIGDSVYTWAGYATIIKDNKPTTIFISSRDPRNSVSLWHIISCLKQISEDGKYHFALVDSGNGNGAFFKSENEKDYYEYGDEIDKPHLSPATILVT